MARKKVARKKKTARKVSTPSITSRERNLNFMIQVNEPKSLRKDVLEALREIIIFMQGYETFVKIQEEKIATFAKLRADVKALNNLVDSKIKKRLPKGKLKGITGIKKIKFEERRLPEEPQMEERKVEVAPQPEPQEEERSDLEDLEYQLADVENRLKNLN